MSLGYLSISQTLSVFVILFGVRIWRNTLGILSLIFQDGYIEIMTKLKPGDIILTLHSESLLNLPKEEMAQIGHSYEVEAANEEIVSLKGLMYAQLRDNFILIQRGILRLAAINGIEIKQHIKEKPKNESSQAI